MWRDFSFLCFLLFFLHLLHSTSHWVIRAPANLDLHEQKKQHKRNVRSRPSGWPRMIIRESEIHYTMGSKELTIYKNSLQRKTFLKILVSTNKSNVLPTTECLVIHSHEFHYCFSYSCTFGKLSADVSFGACRCIMNGFHVLNLSWKNPPLDTWMIIVMTENLYVTSLIQTVKDFHTDSIFTVDLLQFKHICTDWWNIFMNDFLLIIQDFMIICVFDTSFWANVLFLVKNLHFQPSAKIRVSWSATGFAGPKLRPCFGLVIRYLQSRGSAARLSWRWPCVRQRSSTGWQKEIGQAAPK